MNDSYVFLYSGWLGIIVGSKLYINYAKKPFEAAYSETLVELQATMQSTDKKSSVSPAKKRIFCFYDSEEF
jgi:hypothetical protein